MKWLFLALLALAAPATAYDESAAPSVDDRIAEVGHSPDPVEPGMQWQGFIRFQDGHNVTDVRYQICRVGNACFAGPTLAQQVDGNTWRFDTNEYGPRGQTIDWGINHPGTDGGDWRVGVQYVFFTDGEDHTDFDLGEFVPHGKDLSSDDCSSRQQFMACSETHYFAFDMPGRAPTEEAPAPFALVLLSLLGLTRLAKAKADRRDARD